MEKFYKLQFDGVLYEYHKIGYDKEGIPVWTDIVLTDCNQFESWKIKEVDFNIWIKNTMSTAKYISKITFSEEYAKKIKGFYPADKFEEAKKCSKKLWDKIIAPDEKYKVVKYCDNVFDGYVSDKALSKKEAYDLIYKISEDKSNYKSSLYLYSFKAVPMTQIEKYYHK